MSLGPLKDKYPAIVDAFYGGACDVQLLRVNFAEFCFAALRLCGALGAVLSQRSGTELERQVNSVASPSRRCSSASTIRQASWPLPCTRPTS